MSQDTGLFSVRRPREVNFHACNIQALLTIHLADIGWYQLQLRNSTTCFRLKTLQFYLQHQRELCTAHIPPCSLGLLLSHVARSQSASTAQFSACLIRRQLQYSRGGADKPSVYSAAKLFFQHVWRCVRKQNELCAGCNDASEPAIVERCAEHAAKKQHMVSILFHWRDGPPIVFHTSASSS